MVSNMQQEMYMIAYMFNCFTEHVKAGPVCGLLQSITDVQM